MMGLLDLPSELIASIFVFLDDVDVFTARQSNKSVERASFSHFGKRFFRKKGFLVTSPSLKVLGEIAEHEELRKYVQHLWFNPDCYTFARPECCPDEIEDETLDEADGLESPMGEVEAKSKLNEILGDQYNAYRQCVQDHSYLLSTPTLVFLLTSTFQELPNLVTVGMRRSEDYSPYGWKDLFKAVGEDPRILGPIPSGPVSGLSDTTRLFVAIIAALADSGVRLERLYTDAVEIDNILKSSLSQTRLDTACSSILYLELNAIRGMLKPLGFTGHFNSLNNPSDYGAGLLRLLKATTNLKEIGLQIFPDRKQSHLVAPRPRDPESWRTSYPYLSFARIANETKLPNLTRVKLEKITTTSDDLIQFLKPSAATLSSLKIRDIRLLSSEEDARPWQSFFSFLFNNCQELEYILFYHLMYEKGGVAFVQIAPSVMPIEDDMLIDHVPQSHGGHALFAGYDHITLEVNGKDEIRQKLEEVRTDHWYHKPLFSYAMDEDLWHTDTSDEDW